jgi:UDP-2,3-diacylglucosamine hydrolase
VQPLGLIAGEGVFPLLVARGARAAGRKVVCCGLAGNAREDLQREVDSFKWVGVLRLGQWIRTLRAAGCSEAIMTGRVRKARMYSRWRYFQYIPDWRTAKLWFTRLRRDKRDHAVLLAVADELAMEGITLIDSTAYCQDQLATAGVMTRRQPTAAQWADIRFGYDLCKTIARLDIGQALAVMDKDVIAVEAMEGTNAMIDRAAQYCRVSGWTLIKVANAQQDMRMDVPSIGVTTIEKLAAANAGCLVLEPGKTILLEKDKVLEMADRLKIAVVGYSAEERK